MTQPIKRRNPSGLGSFRKRHETLWEGRITLPDGERVSIYGKTEREAKRKARERLEDAERGLDTARGKVTVRAYVSQWIDDALDSNRIRPGTAAAYRSHLKTHTGPHLGKMPLRELTPHHVNRMLAAIVKGGASGTTANRVRATLRAALNDAMSERIVPDNAAKLSRARKESRDRIQPLELDQVKAMLKATRDDDLGPLFRIAVETGLRQGELLALQWGDVDLDAGVISVRHTLTRTKDDGWKLSDTKTPESKRTVRITPAAVKAFRQQRALNAQHQLLATQYWKRSLRNPGYRQRGEDPDYSEPHQFDLVFMTKRGNPHHGSTVTHRFQELIEEAKLPPQRFHDLRHAAASTMLSQGIDLHTVKETLGHSQYHMTANIYGHLTEKRADEVAEAMDRALGDDA